MRELHKGETNAKVLQITNDAILSCCKIIDFIQGGFYHMSEIWVQFSRAYCTRNKNLDSLTDSIANIYQSTALKVLYFIMVNP